MLSDFQNASRVESVLSVKAKPQIVRKNHIYKSTELSPAQVYLLSGKEEERRATQTHVLDLTHQGY